MPPIKFKPSQSHRGHQGSPQAPKGAPQLTPTAPQAPMAAPEPSNLTKKKSRPSPAQPHSLKLTEPELPRAYPLPASLTEGSPSIQSRKGTPRHSVPAPHLLTEGPRAPRTCRTSPEGAQLRRRALLPAPATAPPPPPHDFKPNGRPGPPIRERRSRRARQSEERAAGGGRGQRRA